MLWRQKQVTTIALEQMGEMSLSSKTRIYIQVTSLQWIRLDEEEATIKTRKLYRLKAYR